MDRISRKPRLSWRKMSDWIDISSQSHLSENQSKNKYSRKPSHFIIAIVFTGINKVKPSFVSTHREKGGQKGEKRGKCNAMFNENATQHFHPVQQQQEKLTNCGTKAADVLDQFLAGNHNANPLNNLVHLQLLDFTTPINSKCR